MTILFIKWNIKKIANTKIAKAYFISAVTSAKSEYWMSEHSDGSVSESDAS